MKTKIIQSQPFAYESSTLVQYEILGQTHSGNIVYTRYIRHSQVTKVVAWQQILTNHSHLLMKVRFCTEEYTCAISNANIEQLGQYHVHKASY